MAYNLVAGTGPVNVDLTTKGRRVASWAFSNITAAAVINLRNGTVTGDKVIQVQLAVGASASEAYGQVGVLFPLGVFVEIVTGTITGSIDLY
jgi:hypothetical protein